MRLASSVASEPTSVRSEISACCRSASICDCALSVIRRASASARSRSSAMIWPPCSVASARIREASCRASDSCWRYWSSSAAASAWASSARLMPPWMASSRSDSVFTIRGSSIRPSTPKTTRKTMMPMISSGQVGTSGSCAAASAR
jgi:hypothetical protein